MSWFEENKQIILAVGKGVFAFFMLFGMLVAGVIFYDFTNINMNVLSFILAATCAVFLANNIYDVSVSAVRIKKLAETRAQKLIASSQQLFLEVYNNSPVAYVIVGEYGDIVSANTAAARLFGQPADKLVKRDLFALMGTGNEEHQSVLKQKFKHGITVSDDDVKISHGIVESWTKVSIFKFSSTDGKNLSLVTFVDVTKQKEIDIAKTEFVSLASHQLRTPISGMRWSAELLLMDGVETLSIQQKRYIDRLLSSIERMSGLVDDFLQVSRFELGTRVLKLEDVILAELCDDVLAEQTELVVSKRLKVVKEYDDTIKKINTDQGLLRMILTNLTTNAVKYSRSAGEITVSYRRINGDLEIQIKDTGMGIPVREQARVFSKIFRASNAIKEVPDGTGLGLYIVKKAVEQMRGRISFVSDENAGTTFTVVLPGSF
jgi:PAS domain S-box-containing protein